MSAPLATVLRHVRRLEARYHNQAASDRHLLERFTNQRDEVAFAQLVRRHGGMVHSVARRILHDPHAAEDVFQNTFLTLARRAGSIRKREALASWLYGAAARLAMRMRVCEARRSARERKTVRPPAEDVAEASAWRELGTVLDEELQRLPEKYRAPLVLIYFAGQTQEEVARQLACGKSALRGRLERGKRLLHDRLLRRGVSLSVALLAAGVAQTAVQAALPPALVEATVRRAVQAATTQTALWAAGMGLLSRAKMALAVGLLAAAGAGVAIFPAASGEQPEAKQEAAKTPAQEGKQPRVDRFGDPLPEGALLRLGSIRWRAGPGINHAALSPDGKTLAAASESGITLFDLATGKPRYLRESGVPNGFDTLGSKLAFSPDGKQLVSVTTGGNLRFWDAATGKLLRAVGKGAELERPQKGGIGVPIPPVAANELPSKVWFPPQGKMVVAASQDNTVLFVDPSTGKTRRSFQVGGEVASVASDGKTLAAVDAKHSEVILYDDQGKELRRILHAGKIDPVALGQAGKRLVTVNDRAEIKVWDAPTGKELRNLAAPAAKSRARTPTVVSIAPDGGTLFAGTQVGDILRWDLRTGAQQAPLRGHQFWVTGLFHAPDGQTLVSVSWDSQIHRWNLRTGKAEPNGEGYVNYVRVTRSPDGRTIAVGASSGRLEFWDAATGRRLRAFSLPAKSFSQLRYSSDGKRLALACTDARVRIWDVDKERVQCELKLPPSGQPGGGGESWFEGLAWSPDGRFLATSLRGDGLRMWETATGKEIWHEARQGAVTFSPDGKTLVSAGWDKDLTFQDAFTGKVRSALKEERNSINDIAFSPDGSSLATCHHGGNVYLRDPKTGEVRKTLQGHVDVAWSVSFSPDSKWLASSGDETVRVWEVATGVEVLRRAGHESRAYQAEFGPDGRTVLSSSLDLTALLWDLRPGAGRGRKRPLETLWTDFAGSPAKAYRAIWELADDPKAASDFLRRQIAPVHIDVDERRVRDLLKDLDSDDFAKREAAGRALAAMGPAVEGRLRRALADTQSAEARRRLRGLLDGLRREPTTEDVRRMRAVQIMELCGTAEALRVLRDWAGGTADAPLTEAAKAALGRLARRP